MAAVKYECKQYFCRATAAEQMMNTLPEDWKKSRVKKKTGLNNRNKKRPGGPIVPPQPPKKKAEDDGKIVITADNPVSCLYEYAKKVRGKYAQIIFTNLFISCRKKYPTQISIALLKIY